MILYHGSNTKIEKIDLSLSRKGKDFGQGFYLNANRKQAEKMANRAVKVNGQGESTINTYLFKEEILSNPGDLKIKVFDDYTEEWADFIVKNRNNKSDCPIHPYDIVIGPIADDTVGIQIRRFVMGYLTPKQLIEELRFHGDYAIQYFFGTERAIKLLKKMDDEQ
jgi:hypothetical protein